MNRNIKKWVVWIFEATGFASLGIWCSVSDKLMKWLVSNLNQWVWFAFACLCLFIASQAQKIKVKEK